MARKSFLPFTLIALLTAPVFASTPGIPPAAPAPGAKPAEWVTFHNDFYWLDDKGQRIQTRSGCLRNFDGTFYWYGGTNGFRDQMCYSSTDLIHWTNRGVVLHHIVDANRIEVLYNAPTKKYVMFLKYDTNGAFFGIANADKPEGPFSFKQPPVSDAQMVAMNADQLKAAGPFYLVDNARMGDMSVWQDDDGTAYLAYVSWAIGTNRQHGVYRLSADYQSLDKRLQLWDIGGREANHIFKRDGLYYYGTSRTAGIASSGTSYYTTKDITNGPWTAAKPMPTPGSNNSWDSQVDFIYPFKGPKETLYMFVGDRWTKDLPKGRNGDYIFLPLEFNGADPVANYYQDWDLNVTQGTWRKFDPARNLAAGKPVTASSESPAGPARNVTAQTLEVTSPTGPRQVAKTFENYIDSHWDSAPTTAEAPNAPQWITVDLAAPTDINRVILKWNTTAARDFKIQTSLDNATWTDVFTTTLGGSYSVTDETFKTTSARYVRMYATQRAANVGGGRGGGGAGRGGRGRGATLPATAPATGPDTTPATAPVTGRGPLAAQPGYSLFDFEVLKD